MKLFRSFGFIAMALAAIVAFAMPSVASVPIDPGIHIDPAKVGDHQAPAAHILKVDADVLACKLPAADMISFNRSHITAPSRLLHGRSSGYPASFIEVRRRC